MHVDFQRVSRLLTACVQAVIVLYFNSCVVKLHVIIYIVESGIDKLANALEIMMIRA